MTLTSILSLLVLPLIFFPAEGGGGEWVLLQDNIGITAMHMQLLNNDRVVIYDRTDFGLSNISLPGGKCRDDSHDPVVNHDCTAHSVEYNVVSNTVRPLMVQTDVWCSSGTVAPDGYLMQTGGFNDGERVVRLFGPCDDERCDWEEKGVGLLVRRWYATNHVLPDGRAIVIGGRRQFNYEFYPKSETTNSLVVLHFLRQTFDKADLENNLYPFVHLNVDGNLFVFANNRSVLLDYTKNVVVRRYPDIPGGHPRNYPSSGSSVLLPLKNLEAEVLICGGAPRGSAELANSTRRFIKALDSCGRIKITDASPNWVMETMPLGRVMGDMILLPNGHVMIINGAGAGSAGWFLGRNPVLHPVLYKPDDPLGHRFSVQNPSSIPRMYHSTAILLRDARILVGGSNPNVYYNFTGVDFPTELRLEAFSPDYLDPLHSSLRPKIVYSSPPHNTLSYGEELVIHFAVRDALRAETVLVAMLAPPFTTHSFSMSQRLVALGGHQGDIVAVSDSVYKVRVTAPKNRILAPPGYYMLFVSHADIPSEGMWVKIHH